MPGPGLQCLEEIIKLWLGAALVRPCGERRESWTVCGKETERDVTVLKCVHKGFIYVTYYHCPDVCTGVFRNEIRPREWGYYFWLCSVEER